MEIDFVSRLEKKWVYNYYEYRAHVKKVHWKRVYIMVTKKRDAFM